ncbi:MAG TPA: prohibitin family protein [Candidatus Acidoferrum sp.]|nr:prohibitin family protein [Candidatus Acidoferrum sp.]
MSPQNLARIIGVGILVFIIILMASAGTYVVHPGHRGVEIIMGKVTPIAKKEGFGFKVPLVTQVRPISIRQQTAEDQAQCYSSDLQQIHIELRILFRVPEASVVQLYRDYQGDVFESLVAPRIHEALKEVTALQSAEQIVKNREQLKSRALDLSKQKIGTLVVIEDIVIQNIRLTKELEHAIEAKMVQEQEAQRSKYVQTRAQIEADTAVIKARGEAQSIRIRGDALKANPTFVDLQVVDRWDGVAPLIIGGQEKFVLPLSDLERLKQNASPIATPVRKTR